MADISTSIRKIDCDEKISGSIQYTSDIAMPYMLYAKTLRATIACGTIKAIHIPQIPQGYYIINHTHIPGKNFVRIIFEDMPIFAVNKIAYFGEPILLVVGENKAKIIEIIENIKVEYDEKTPVLEYINSAVHYKYQKGKPEVAFARANKIISHTYDTGYQEQAYIEPQAMIGYPEDDKITLVGSIQCPYYVKNAVISALDCDDDKVRVIQAAVGGAFGGKEEFPSLMATQLAVAVLHIQKPIKLIYEREEDMEVTTKRHPSTIQMQAAIGENNTILAIRTHVSLNGGAYIGLSGVVLSRALIAATGAYTIDAIDASGDVFITNTVPTGAFRGFGAPQMLFAIEMFIHHIAKALNCDPFNLRLHYLAKQHDATSTSGTFNDPIIMPKMIEKATVMSNYHEKLKLYNNKQFRGIGMSWFFHGCGFTGSGEATHIKAKVKLHKDENNKVYILIAAVDMGQGIKTTMTKLVAHMLDIPLSQVVFDNPDTDFVPDSGPTVASRTMMIVGGLVARATLKLKERWMDGVAQDIIEQYQQPKHIKWDESLFIGDAYPAYSWGVNVVEVEVCPITYQVKVIGAWSVYDVGKAIDELVVLGQADGGLVQGMSYAYLEVMHHKNGRLQQKNMTDYIIPTAADIPRMETVLMENPYALGPYGAKGVGELTLVGAAPALALAIEQAIKRKITKIPVTPEYIMELMMHDED